MDASVSEQIAQWLSDTTSSDEATVRSASAHLELAQKLPGFASCLLTISAVGVDQGQRTAAITYLKNYVRNHLNDGGLGEPNEQLEFRNRLVHLLLQADTPVLKIFTEVFHLVIVNDFVRENRWPELIPSLRTAVQSSDMVSAAGLSSYKTINAFIAVQTLIKPFQYFMNPTMAREPVPEQLESISKDLLVPSYGLFHQFIEQSATSNGIGITKNYRLLLTLFKCFRLAVRSHMPTSLIPSLPAWHQDCILLLNSTNLEEPIEEFKLKAVKRVFQICCTLVTRHRKYADKFMPDMILSALRIIKQKILNDKFYFLRERVLSLALDVVSHVLETGPGWRLVAPHFSSLLESAIFPALRFNEKDMLEWQEDTDEYLAKNLPSELDEASGWKEDLYTPRKSALNLLSVMALSKGPPMADTSNKVTATKRKKGRGKGTRSAGELLVIPFLSKFAIPCDGSSSDTDTVRNYYGVLLAYGGLAELFKGQTAEFVAIFLQNRVLPLYLMSSPSPYLVANANWLLGEFASCLPEDLNQVIYTSLLKAIVAPNIGNVSWYPVRASAVGALNALLQEEYTPKNWSDFLHMCVSALNNEQECCLLLRLLANAAEVGLQGCTSNIPAIVSAIKAEIVKHIPPIPNPWPQVVELGFSALAAMAKCWDDSEPDETENNSNFEHWKSGCLSIANVLGSLLLEAWSSHSWDNMAYEILPAPSGLNDVSVLLRFIMKYTSDYDTVSRYNLEVIMRIWADLIAEWNAWDEEEDLAVFEAIQEALLFNEKLQLKTFLMSNIPPPPAPPIAPRSSAEGIATFIISAIELGYSAATWRACYVAHSLLHIPNFSFECEGLRETVAIRFTQASYARYQKLQTANVPVAKPLLLLLSACYLCFPTSVEKVLMEENQAKSTVNGFVKWAEAVANLADDTSEPVLMIESEFKLAAMTLARVLDNLVYMENNAAAMGTAHKCFHALLESLIRLKEIQESEMDEDEDDEVDTENHDSDLDSDEDEEDSSDDEYEETEEQFLERYAQAACNLEKEMTENAERGDEEDGKIIELGIFSKEDAKYAALSVIQKHRHMLPEKQSLPSELITKFSQSFPTESHQLFS